MATTTSRHLTIEHVTIACARRFDDVATALAASLPPLDTGLQTLMEEGRRDEVAALRDRGPPLYLFLTRQHGALLAVDGIPAKANQYEIGNPITAESMTRWRLAAGLYAPLRIILYEDGAGRSFFEYDRPSSLFSQFGVAQVTEVGLMLDGKLEAVLMDAAG